MTEERRPDEGTVDASASAFLGLVGLATMVSSAARMPFWARTRARQMDEVAAEVVEVTGLPPAEPHPSLGPVTG